MDGCNWPASPQAPPSACSVSPRSSCTRPPPPPTPGYLGSRRTKPLDCVTSWQPSARRKRPESELPPNALPVAPLRLSPLSPIIRIGRSFLGLIALLTVDRVTTSG